MELNCVEVPLEFAVAAGARANPFHWALLSAVAAFPAGARPEFKEIAERLQFFEPTFLTQAWTELGNRDAVTSGDFNHAELTEAGREALRIGYLLKGTVNQRRVTLVFSARGDRCVERRDFELVPGARLRQPPAWASALSLERILEAMSYQMPLQVPTEGERIVEFKLIWEDAGEAVARW